MNEVNASAREENIAKGGANGREKIRPLSQP